MDNKVKIRNKLTKKINLTFGKPHLSPQYSPALQCCQGLRFFSWSLDAQLSNLSQCKATTHCKTKEKKKRKLKWLCPLLHKARDVEHFNFLLERSVTKYRAFLQMLFHLNVDPVGYNPICYLQDTIKPVVFSHKNTI